MKTQKEQIELIIEWALEKKAADVKHFDIHEESDFTDFVLVCNGSGRLHVQAIAQNIIEQCKINKMHVYSTEGMDNGTWVLIDLVDIIVHIFDEETRTYYNIEKLLEVVPPRA